jgi:hypothetical protein
VGKKGREPERAVGVGLWRRRDKEGKAKRCTQVIGRTLARREPVR